MLRTLLLTTLLALPFTAHADNCIGQNLFDSMPAAELTALKADAAKLPYGQGLLWQAQKDGQTLTVFGTYHLPHEQTAAHFKAVWPHAHAADVSYFEMTAADTKLAETEIATNPDIMFNTKGPTLPDVLNEDEWQQLSSELSARGFPAFIAAKMKPIFAMSMLGMTTCTLKRMQAGGPDSKGIDARLATALSEAERPTLSIEHFTAALAALDVFTAEEQVAMLRLTLLSETDGDDMIQTLLSAYLEGQTALLWQFTKQLSLLEGGPTAEADFGKFEDALLVKRNLAWIDTLASEAHENVFVAVGAAHLIGQQGLLNLLAKRGYAVTPLPLKP